MSKFTPGPWKTTTGGRFVTDAGAVVIAHVEWADFRPEYAANCSLIAAAPDLLEALQGLLAMPDYDATTDTSLLRWATKKAAKAAITKALAVPEVTNNKALLQAAQALGKIEFINAKD